MNNRANAGAAVYAECDSVTLDNNSFVSNSIDAYEGIVGGAVVLMGDHCVMTECSLEGNTVTEGIYCDYSEPNDALGAALYVGGESVKIVRSCFTNNALHSGRKTSKGGQSTCKEHYVPSIPACLSRTGVKPVVAVSHGLVPQERVARCTSPLDLLGLGGICWHTTPYLLQQVAQPGTVQPPVVGFTARPGRCYQQHVLR